MGKRIGIYGGSFDPIHFGHLNLAIEILEAQSLDEVWFCPASLNPHKHLGCSANSQHRLNMLHLALEGEPRFKITEIEITRAGPSFTLDTLKEITASQKNEPDTNQFFLMLGEDAARNFFKWYEPEQIIKYARLLVGRRHTEPFKETFQGSPSIIKAIEEGLTPTRVMDVSSTIVRERLAKRLYCKHLVPGKVLDYIIINRLYLNA